MFLFRINIYYEKDIIQMHCKDQIKSCLFVFDASCKMQHIASECFEFVSCIAVLIKIKKLWHIKVKF